VPIVCVNACTWPSACPKGVETLGDEGQMSRRSEAENIGQPAIPLPGERSAFIGRLQMVLRQWPSADRLARATGVSPSAFRKWLRGEAEPSRERLVALAQAAGVSVGWLASGEGPEPRLRSAGKHSRAASFEADLNRQDYILLPKRPEAAAAGPDPSPPPPPVEYLAIRHDWVRSMLGIEPNHLMLETAVGESMRPNIQDGDLLLIDATEHRIRGVGIYVLEISGERLVKRVQPKLDGSLTLISDNAAYETEHILPAQVSDIHVVGRVIWTCGPPR
jgi:phage repressor protein C with HTH and peptisase S24 domain